MAKAGSSAMPMRPASPIEWMSGTRIELSFFAFGLPLSNIKMVPIRSVTKSRPSGANARSHGTERLDCTTVSVSVGAPPRCRVSLGPPRPPAQPATNTPSNAARAIPRIPLTTGHSDGGNCDTAHP